MSNARLDPITFEVIKNALSSAADEMALIVMRSAYSPVVRDTMDYSTALCDRRGQLIAQGLTLAVQLGSFPDGMRILMADHAPTAQPGDVFLYNDPYGSGGPRPRRNHPQIPDGPGRGKGADPRHLRRARRVHEDAPPLEMVAVGDGTPEGAM